MLKANINLPKIDKTTGVWLAALSFAIASTAGITYTLATNKWHLISPVRAEETKIPVKQQSNTNNRSYNDPFFDNWGSSLNDPFFWDPFREMDLYRRRMYQMFNHLDSSFAANDQAFYNPQLSLEQGDKSYLVKVDLPGLEKDSINVELENNLLTISGQREVAKETNDDQGFYHSERSYGSFSRSITLPEDIEDDHIDANYKNGVLTVEIPRNTQSNKVSKKKIQVN